MVVAIMGQHTMHGTRIQSSRYVWLWLVVVVFVSVSRQKSRGSSITTCSHVSLILFPRSHAFMPFVQAIIDRMLRVDHAGEYGVGANVVNMCE